VRNGVRSIVQRALPITALATVLGASGIAQTAPGPVVPQSFDAVRSALSAVSLSDRENGEILGTALDIVERPDLPERQPAADPHGPAHRLAVLLAPGALDKLRRASEFRREDPAADAAGTRPALVYVRDEPLAIRVTVTEEPVRAIIEVSRRP
jgi:hypothetical protein